MLQAAGFFVHLVPLHTKHIDQKTLGQAMTPQHGLSGCIASFGQMNLALLVHLHIAVPDQALQHLGHRWRSHVKLLGQARPNHDLVLRRHVIDGL